MSVGNKIEDIAKWYAVYTYPRHEKKLAKQFEINGIECFCPLNKVEKQWSDRKKVVFVPLFQSYIFVHVKQSEFSKVRNTKGVLNFVYWQGKPAVIQHNEIEIIKSFVAGYTNIEVKSLNDPVPGDIVNFNSGVLLNNTGVISNIYNSYVEVILDKLDIRILARITKSIEDAL
ncbi:UpxY family transcription antiterminator [Polluticaenibacter yanchengensis]|uniref:UpxY family transcription antiterminator n=1 Tax=Polluticaenibacter yanchengensis TaxID=3014562 RepID=A0ABT4UH60_9BACT|nr:UpxY family transcription antiterminator [Chitinophagaceae bacterium LY-5]